MTQHIKNPLVYYIDKSDYRVFASCSCGWWASFVRNLKDIVLDTSEMDGNAAWVDHFIRGDL